MKYLLVATCVLLASVRAYPWDEEGGTPPCADVYFLIDVGLAHSVKFAELTSRVAEAFTKLKQADAPRIKGIDLVVPPAARSHAQGLIAKEKKNLPAGVQVDMVDDLGAGLATLAYSINRPQGRRSMIYIFTDGTDQKSICEDAQQLSASSCYVAVYGHGANFKTRRYYCVASKKGPGPQVFQDNTGGKTLFPNMERGITHLACDKRLEHAWHPPVAAPVKVAAPKGIQGGTFKVENLKETDGHGFQYMSPPHWDCTPKCARRWGGKCLPACAVIRSETKVWDTSAKAKAGQYYLGLQGNAAQISQTIQTTPGSTYKVSFHHRKRWPHWHTAQTEDKPVHLKVTVSGAFEKTFPAERLNWKDASFTFKATAKSHIIRFQNVCEPTADLSLFLDDIQMKDVTNNLHLEDDFEDEFFGI